MSRNASTLTDAPRSTASLVVASTMRTLVTVQKGQDLTVTSSNIVDDAKCNIIFEMYENIKNTKT